MKRRSVWTGLGFLLAAAALAAALGWITVQALALEAREAAALARAIHEENIRIGLWRMDAALAELLSAENRRPAEGYAAPRAGLELAARSAEEERRELFHARFELRPKGQLRLDRAAEAAPWLAALPMPPSPPPVRPTRPRRATPSPQPAPQIAALEPEPGVDDEPERTVSKEDLFASLARPGDPKPGGGGAGQRGPHSQETLNTQAFAQRRDLARQNALVLPPQGSAPSVGEAAPAGRSPPVVEVVVVESPFEAHWVGEELVLTRTVLAGRERRLQGAWLDSGALGSWLLALGADLVPGAQLAASASQPDPGRQLALLPFALVPGPPASLSAQGWTPIRLSLATAWVATLLCLGGVGILLAGSVRLAERRADFVSAVTHELRTPLTTLRLYTDLLTGSAGDAGERSGWLATLRREAERLSYLVENVLAFSRLEHRGRPAEIEPRPLEELLTRALPRLAERAEQAGFELRVELSPELLGSRVLARETGLEQILFNLVDNACKYAATVSDRRLHLEGSLAAKSLCLRLADHGPGLAPDVRRRMFRSFHRSASRAAGQAPGVGLGLALSRSLAREMGGELLALEPNEGAAFELRLKRSG